MMLSWYNIFKLLLTIPKNINITYTIPEKPLVVFVADGGWGPWKGSDILTKGVGGSETYIIEIARWVQRSGKFDCIVFCNCEQSETFEGVKYESLNKYSDFIMTHQLHTIIISRYSEYIPLSLQSQVENIYLVLHDLSPSGLIIPTNDKLKKVLCLTDWHKDFFINSFRDFSEKTDSFYYGIDNIKFKPGTKIKNSFIYSSFPNRGLLPLLQMWSKIKKAIPDATLNVYSDINGKWVNDVDREQMDEIRKILNSGMLEGVTIHGWVSKKDLAEAWSRADIWLYPCIFKETFCLTALEAAASKTLAIGVPLAALTETIGDRGILIDGDPLTNEWQDKALKEILDIVSNPNRKMELIEKNYRWAQNMSWKQRGEEFISKYLDMDELDKINTFEMYNWVHDKPKDENSKQKFVDALTIANPNKILEIGSYTGTSVIEMLKMYPQANATVINVCDNYEEKSELGNTIKENRVEQTFYDNLKRAVLSDKIEVLKGNITDTLCNLIKDNQLFDFVHVNANHKCFDSFTDMVLGWQLVRKGGVLALDDVLYGYEKVKEGHIFEYPLVAKLYFMEKYNGQYEVISDSYRLFIKKL
jgi:glycosyltransferase involved in cell wall biosynthesis/predicted O-methyltransferase YrrM